MATITIESRKQIKSCDILLVFPNETWKYVTLYDLSAKTLELHDNTLPLTVFVSAEGYKGRVEKNWVPADGDLRLRLEEMEEDGGSRILWEVCGHFLGLEGHMQARLIEGPYYSDAPIEITTMNLAVNGRNHTTRVPFDAEVALTDHLDKTLYMAIRAIEGKCVLLDWWPDRKTTKRKPSVVKARTVRNTRQVKKK